MAQLLCLRSLKPDPVPTLERELILRRGDSLVLLGAAGAGKSRLLGWIAEGGPQGTRAPATFELDLMPGIEPVLWAAERTMGRLRARDTVLAHLEEAIRKLPRRARPAQAEAQRRITTLLETFELGTVAERRARELSGSERRRLALACTLVAKPALLLLDEPLAGIEGDPKRRLLGRLGELARAWGVTTIFATQSVEEAWSWGAPGTPVALLEESRLIQCASVAELDREPSHRAVAQAFGVNLVEGRLDLRDGEQLFVFPDGESEGAFPLNFVTGVPDVPGAEPGRGSVVLGVRPDALKLARTPEELGSGGLAEAATPSQLILPGWEAPWLANREEAIQFGLLGGALRRVARIAAVDRRRLRARVEVELGSHRWVVDAPAAPELAVGERCWLELDREQLLWFDAQGSRLHAPSCAHEDEGAATVADSPRGLTQGEREPGTAAQAEAGPG